MNKLFAYFSKRENFLKAILGTDYDNETIVFIADTKEIWNRGTFYATPNDFDINDYLTIAEAAELYQPVGNYVELEKYVEDLAKKADKTDLDDMATKTWVTGQDYDTKDSVDKKVADVKAEILGDDLTETFDTLKAVQDWADEHGTEYAALVEDVNTKATKTELNEAVNNINAEVEKKLDASEAADTYVTKTYAEETYLKEHQSLEDYATKEYVDAAIDAVDVTEQLQDYVTKETADATYQPKGEYYTKEEVDEVVNDINDTAAFVKVGKGYVISDTAKTELFDKNLGKGAVIEGIGLLSDWVISASGTYSHAEGKCTVASGTYSHAEGFDTVASNECAHAEGQKTTASNLHSHAEGYFSIASGSNSHAEGMSTEAKGICAHAEGFQSNAEADYSHAEGHTTKATGEHSHAEGYYTQANGLHSHAEGHETTAENEDEHASGRYNKPVKSENEDATLFTIGNGYENLKEHISNKRHNAFEVRVSGEIYIPDTSAEGEYWEKPMIKLQDFATKAYVDASLEEIDVTTQLQDYAKTEDVNNQLQEYLAKAEAETTYVKKSDIDDALEWAEY